MRLADSLHSWSSCNQCSVLSDCERYDSRPRIRRAVRAFCRLACPIRSRRRAWLVLFAMLSALALLTGRETLSPLGMIPCVRHRARKIRWLLYLACFSLRAIFQLVRWPHYGLLRAVDVFYQLVQLTKAYAAETSWCIDPCATYTAQAIHSFAIRQ